MQIFQEYTVRLDELGEDTLLWLWIGRRWRSAVVLAVVEEEVLVEYSMPSSVRLWIAPVSPVCVGDGPWLKPGQGRSVSRQRLARKWVEALATNA